MTDATYRPEPGIATDEELETAVSELREALGEDIVDLVEAERFAGGTDRWTEVIRVWKTDARQATDETVVNDALLSGADVRVRTLDPERDYLTFYPTNQKE